MLGVGQVGGAAFISFAYAPIDMTGCIITSDAQARFASIGVANSAAASVIPVSGLVSKIEVFDGAGVSLGFVPVYSSIT